MKLDRFVNQAVITTSCSPVWDVVALNIRVTTLGTFLLPTIFHFNLGVININQFHRGNILQDFSGEVNNFFQNIVFLFFFCYPKDNKQNNAQFKKEQSHFFC
jgi:hypothetical protein